MVDSSYFDKLEAVARAVRKKDFPFGGVQLILSGDFLQLPPVVKDIEKKKFCFQVGITEICLKAYLANWKMGPETNPCIKLVKEIEILQHIV